MSMPKIEHVLGDGPELAESQRRVLELLDSHPDFIFRMADISDIQSWLSDPKAPEPPQAYYEYKTYKLGTIKWALSTLHARAKIGSDKFHRRTYYGSHEAIKRAQALRDIDL